MRVHRSRPPLWFELLVVVLSAAIGYAFGLVAVDAAPVSHGFLGFLIAAASWIWRGVQAVGQATIAWLHWAVMVLWTFAKSIWNAIVTLGSVSMKGIQHTWRFFRDTYEHILKPAWLKFWQLVDRVRNTLERVLRPVFDVLRRIRDEVMAFYEKFVRPVLDVIGIARKTLRVFSTLGLDWARALDRKLGTLEEKIDAPFRLVLRKVNEVINLVNQVVTANGLFQRLALIRSIERDVRFVNALFWASQTTKLSAATRDKRLKPLEPQTIDEHVAETQALVLFGEGRHAALSEELAGDIRLALGIH